MEEVRLDKWLWAARFFKTRALAKDAIDGGKVHLNGHRVKASKTVRIGHQLEITRGFDVFVVDVIALAEKRGPAKIAQTLYQETPESLKKREEASLQRKALAGSDPSPKQRPTKKQRRQIKMLKDFLG